MVEGERRFRAFVVVQRVASESVAAAAGRKVVERLLQAVATEKPLERANRPCSVLGLARDAERAQLRLDESCGVDGLFVAGTRRRFASTAAAMAGETERVSVEPASLPNQRSEPSPSSARSGRSSAVAPVRSAWERRALS